MSKKWLFAMMLVATGLCAVQAEDAKPPRKPEGAGDRGGFGSMDQNGDGKITVDEMTAGMAERIKMRFTRIDKDADGKVTQAEFDAGRPPSPPEGAGRQAREMPAFADLDANKDGSVTLEEMTSHAKSKMQERVKEMDKNGDGVIGEDERPSRGPQGGAPRRDGPPPAP